MPDWVLGVDLGTSFCAGAFATVDRVEILEVGRERRIPSTILLDDSGRLVAGSLAQRMTGRSPERAERNPKRYVGRTPMLLGGVPVEARDALAALLDLFVAEGRSRFDGTPPAAVALTHPVSWGEARRAVLRAAGESVLPGTDVRLIEEPIAAAVHYAATHRLDPDSLVAVYDLGGGTFDSALLATDGTQFVLHGRPGGDDEIGGESFDERVYAHFGAQLARHAPDWWTQVSTNPERRWLAAAADLLGEARAAKETLSLYDTASQYITGADVDVEISRAELDAMIGGDVARTIDLLDETIRQSGAAARRLAGIFLTGGASRTPLVASQLRDRHGDLVRTSDDPKTVVALGAARLAARRFAAPIATGVAVPEVPAAAPEPRRRNPLSVLMDDVADAGGTDTAVYAWRADDPDTSTLTWLDQSLTAADRRLTFGEPIDWTCSPVGLLVADRQDGVARLHTLSPELLIRAIRPLPADHDLTLLLDGSTGWAFLRPRAAAPVDNTVGLPWGETGAQSVLEVPLDGLFARDLPLVSLGDSARWFVNTDNQSRRMLDQDSPTGGRPARIGDDSGCVVVLGQFTSKAPVGSSSSRPGGFTRGRHQDVVPWQVACTVSAGGVKRLWTPRRANWLHQAIYHGDRWFLATAAGLETGTLDAGASLVAARPRAGALRWVRSGNRMYAIGVEQVVPSRGLWIALYEGAELRTLFQQDRSSLIGHLTSVVPSERPRIVTDGDRLWVGTATADGRTRVLRVAPDGVTEAFVRGRLAPVTRVDAGLVCLYDRDADPAGPAPTSSQLVVLPI
jgi:actin-like ATPase involved in cell morphogenesis